MSNNNCTNNHAIVFFFLLSLLLFHTNNFFSSPSNSKFPKPTKPRHSSSSCNGPLSSTSTANPPITFLLPFLSGVLFTLICILAIKFPIILTFPVRSALDFSCSCFRRIKPTNPSPEPSPPPPPPTPTAIGVGISQPLLNSLPIFAYSAEKRPNFGKGDGMCAICLSEFLNEQTLRWLPDCDHLFHRRCVDTWLGSNKTCPCCRANVEKGGGGGGGGILLLENGDDSSEMRSASFRGEGGGRDVDDRRRSGCDRSVVSGLIRVLIGRRRHHANRPRHR